jgi:hypothetical protein
MGPADETRAAVRIELADDVGVVAPPGHEPGGGPGRGLSLVLMVLAAFGLVVLLVVVTRPSEGETAAGTPITSPTTTRVPTESNSATSAGGDSFEEGDVLSPSTTTTEDDQGDRLETSEIDVLIFNVVEAEFGWIALGFGLDDNTGALWRSTDGLEWSEVPEVSLPSGDLLGFDRFDGTYVLAVDELETWSSPSAFDFEAGSFPDHRISVWTSRDAAVWAPSDLPIVEGVGFPYPVSFSPTSYAVPLIDAPEVPNDFLVGFLAPFVDADDAAQVCSSRPQVEADSLAVILEDCDGAVVAEVRREDHPDTFDRLEQSICLQLVLSAGRQRFSTVFAERGADAVRAEFGLDVNLFGRATADGVLTFASWGGISPLPAGCDGESLGPADLGLYHWTVDGGSDDVSPIELSDPQDLRYPFGVMGRSPDGRFFVVSAGSVWSAQPPFDRWDEVVMPLDTSRVGGNEGVRTTISSDGRFAMASSEAGLHLAATDDGRWTELQDIGRNRQAHRILLATDDYVIVVASSGDRLAKIPIPR